MPATIATVRVRIPHRRSHHRAVRLIRGLPQPSRGELRTRAETRAGPRRARRAGVNRLDRHGRGDRIPGLAATAANAAGPPGAVLAPARVLRRCAESGSALAWGSGRPNARDRGRGAGGAPPRPGPASRRRGTAVFPARARRTASISVRAGPSRKRLTLIAKARERARSWSGRGPSGRTLAHASAYARVMSCSDTVAAVEAPPEQLGEAQTDSSRPDARPRGSGCR
jgi:hypothetical protein